MVDIPNPEQNQEPNLSEREKAAVGDFIDQTYELNSIRVSASEERAVTRALKDPTLNNVSEDDIKAQLNGINLSMEVDDQPNQVARYMAEEFQRFVDKEQHYFLLWQNTSEASGLSAQATDFVGFHCTGAGIVTIVRANKDIIEYKIAGNSVKRIDRLVDGTVKSRTLIGDELVRTAEYFESAFLNIKDKVYSQDFPPKSE